jgi:methyl-accepting chemotaxis protein
MRELDGHIKGIADKAAQFRNVFEEIRDGSQTQNENISNVAQAPKQLDSAAEEIARVAQAGVLSEMIAVLR